jgi:hypothetical protein
MSQFPLKYVSPHQVTLVTSISRDKLTNLINLGLIRAKRVDARTVVIDWDSVLAYLDSLPDVVGETETEAPSESVTIASAMQSYNEERRRAICSAGATQRDARVKLSRRRKAKLQRRKDKAKSEHSIEERAFDLNLDRIKRRAKKVLAYGGAQT